VAPNNPYSYRKLPIIIIDLISIAWLIYEMYFSKAPDDFFGIFLFMAIAIGATF